MAVFVIALGIFGAVFSAQHYARYRQHMERAKHYRRALDCLLPQMDDIGLAKVATQVRHEVGEELDHDPLGNGVLTAIKRAGDHAHDRNKPAAILGSITPGALHTLWIALHCFVIALGMLLAVFAIWYPQSWS